MLLCAYIYVLLQLPQKGEDLCVYILVVSEQVIGLYAAGVVPY
jgi:hypothetical protein